MASPQSVLSKTLQSITLSKIRELEWRQKSYEDRKRDYVAKADAAADERDHLACLMEAVKELSGSRNTGLANFQRWLDQSRYDASVPMSKLASFSQQCRDELDIQSRKLDMAHLYSRLLTGMPALAVSLAQRLTYRRCRMDGPAGHRAVARLGQRR